MHGQGERYLGGLRRTTRREIPVSGRARALEKGESAEGGSLVPEGGCDAADGRAEDDGR